MSSVLWFDRKSGTIQYHPHRINEMFLMFNLEYNTHSCFPPLSLAYHGAQYSKRVLHAWHSKKWTDPSKPNLNLLILQRNLSDSSYLILSISAAGVERRTLCNLVKHSHHKHKHKHKTQFKRNINNVPELQNACAPFLTVGRQLKSVDAGHVWHLVAVLWTNTTYACQSFVYA